MEPVPLEQLCFPGLKLYGKGFVSSLTADSRQVKPGSLFVAKGRGESFIREVINSSASALLLSSYRPEYSKIPQLVYPDVSFAEERVASLFYKDLLSSLFLVGTTGTNGKTTTSYLIAHLFKDRCGVIGTIEWKTGKTTLASTHTTPDLLTTYSLFSKMKEEGSSVCAMEVSSHALVQGRVRGLLFDVAVFTNLTQDHLDYHHDMQSYAEAKALLFSQAKRAVVNLDSSYIPPCACPKMTYGLQPLADLFASSVELSSEGMSFELNYGGQKVRVKSCLIGQHNVYNLLAAAGVALIYGMPLEEIKKRMEEPVAIPGRLEKIANKKGIHLFVDYAHTEDALASVLNTLGKIKRRKMITVFGCGGDRDQNKRPKMGAVVERLSDISVVTSDNPRSEDPQKIIEAITQGMTNKGSIHMIPDRYEAIAHAISLASPEDIVLIAGKGHETGQIVQGKVYPFDDRQVAATLGNQ
ncbi:MAG: hypothetical protein RLZZ453_1046 [Chlamydiota bacterium]|jgi:UDP-N-acetylmuramoyl-L-alanyl-D-glutamate--2,6-diaminopimelate ligase